MGITFDRYEALSWLLADKRKSIKDSFYDDGGHDDVKESRFSVSGPVFSAVKPESGTRFPRALTILIFCDFTSSCMA